MKTADREAPRIRDLARLLIDLRYWEGVSECTCASRHPSGGCLKCDMKEGAEVVAKLIEKEGE